MKPTDEEIEKAAKVATSYEDVGLLCVDPMRQRDWIDGANWALQFAGLWWKKPEDAEKPIPFKGLLICFLNKFGNYQYAPGFFGDGAWKLEDDQVYLHSGNLIAWSYLDFPEWLK